MKPDSDRSNAIRKNAADNWPYGGSAFVEALQTNHKPHIAQILNYGNNADTKVETKRNGATWFLSTGQDVESEATAEIEHYIVFFPSKSTVRGRVNSGQALKLKSKYESSAKRDAFRYDAIAACLARLNGNDECRYVASKELVSAFRDSFEFRKSQRESYLTRQFSISQNASTENVDSGAPENEFSEENVKRQLTELISGFLATIGRGVMIRSENAFPLTINGELTDAVLDGFLYRIPIAHRYKQRFCNELFKDLLAAARNRLLSTEYAELTISDGELVLKPQANPPSIVESQSWQKAEVFFPD